MTTIAPPASEIFILPDLGWSCLLDTIAHDAKPGAVLVTYTTAMYLLCEQTVAAIGRDDVTVELRPEPRKERSSGR